MVFGPCAGISKYSNKKNNFIMMEQKNSRPELQTEVMENAETEDDIEMSNKWLILAVLIIWILSFLIY